MEAAESKRYTAQVRSHLRTNIRLWWRETASPDLVNIIESAAGITEISACRGLPHINPHAFRHTVDSILLANGTNIVTVPKHLGHASITTTEDFYSHIIEGNKAKTANCIADILIRKKA